MDEFEVIQVVGFAPLGAGLALQVQGLAADHAAPAGGLGEDAHGQKAAVGGQPFIPGQHGEGLREQTVPRQDGLAFAKGYVAGGLAPPEIVIVHGREIIVDERIGVDVLEGNGAGNRRFSGSAQDLGREHAEHGADPFATGFQAVPHGLAHLWGLSLLER